MITMKTGGKNPVRFVFSDDVSETTITIQTDDPSEAIAAKLQRVLELEGVKSPDGIVGAVAGTFLTAGGVPPSAAFTPADRAEYDQRLQQARPMGWGEGIDIDSLPEA